MKALKGNAKDKILHQSNKELIK